MKCPEVLPIYPMVAFRIETTLLFFLPMRYRDCDAKSFPIDQETGMLRYRLQR